MYHLLVVWSLAMAVALIPIFAVAQVVGPIDPSLPPTVSELQNLLNSLGGMNGASVLGITVALVQIVMMVMRTHIGKIAGKWQLAIVTGLSFAGTILGLRMMGVSWVMCFLHANTATSAQVFAHQILKNFTPMDNSDKIQS
jgi:hypothetical protein